MLMFDRLILGINGKCISVSLVIYSHVALNQFFGVCGLTCVSIGSVQKIQMISRNCNRDARAKFICLFSFM